MKTNLFFILLLSCLFTACQKEFQPVDERLSTQVSPQNATTRPNIILIIGDDVGYEIPTCDGGQSYETPNLDRMAAQGRRYTQCHGSPLCSPSRTALLTGKYNFRNYTKWGYMDPAVNRTIGNMLQDAGYATCYAGKWQLDGYDASIRALGWQKYSVWNPAGIAEAGSRYKNPHIYQDGSFLADNVTLNKYADDMFVDYITSFMSTVTKPYFIYYSMSLVHDPFCPTPDDPEFASWDPNSASDPKYFKSMVKYMDKKIGELLSRIDSNTFVIYVGDNGTPPDIYSLFNGISIKGGKGSSTEYGTHVPLIVYKPGKAPKVDPSLVDLTDFLPTLSGLARISTPATYGILDGTPFYPQTSTRQWLYFHYDKHPDDPTCPIDVWSQTAAYKKYDSTVRYENLAKKNKLINLTTDIDELYPIGPRKETPAEKTVDSTLTSVIRYYALQK